MKILSLQSSVAYGYVGNAAAIFPLQRLGFEAWPVDTVQFSNHPGYGGFTGAVHPPEHVRAILDGLAAAGVLDDCDGVLTGYVGDAESGAAAVAAVARVKATNPRALYLCDPVMGDDCSGIYVRAGIPALMAGPALASADIVTPNRFELEMLAGCPVANLADAIAAARLLLAKGPRLVVATSLAAGPGLAGGGDSADLAGGGDIACLAVTADSAWSVTTPRLPFDPAINGAGDLLSALLLAHRLRGAAPPEALATALSSLFGILQATLALGRRELALVQAQDQLVRPSRLFTAQAI